MKILLFILSIAVISCCEAKRITGTTSSSNKSSSVTANTEWHEPDTSIPLCIKKLIYQFQAEDKQNPPRSVYRYRYNEKTVYFVPAICCDFFSDLYDDKCNLLAHPDGGYTGRGDGRATDFLQTRTMEKLIWEDKRK